MKFKQVYKGFYKGGEGAKAKAPAIKKELTQDTNNLMDYNEIDKHNNFLGYLNDGYLLLDIDNKTADGYDDEKTESNLLIRILKEYGINTPIIETTHGHHFIFKCPSCELNNITGQLLPIGIRADYKIGGKWGWQVLKYNGKVRNIINDTDEVADLPISLIYNPMLKNKLETLEIERGTNGRNSFISSYKFLLKKCGYDDKDIYTICETINNYILYSPLSSKEFGEVMRSETIEMNPGTNINSFLEIKKNGTKSVITHKLAKKVIKDNNLIKIDNYIYTYNGKSYEYIEHDKIKSLILKEYEEITLNKWNETNSKLISLLDHKEVDTDYIALKNGLFNIKDLSLIEHNKNIISTFYIDVNYNPNANTEAMEKYLLELTGNDKDIYNILTEFIGYILYPKNIMKKALIIKGEHNNGKSKFIDVLTSLFGYKNCAILDMKQMTARFGLSGLIGKIVNFGDDISDQYINEESDIKKAISGEPLMIESKGKDSRQYSMNVKFLFSANSLPKFKDPTGAISTRFIIVPFPVSYSVENNNIDFKIVERMTTAENMEALLLLALKGLKRLLINKKFTYSEKSVMLLNEFKEENDPVLLFINEIKETKINGINYFNNISTDEIFNDFNNFCMNGNYTEKNQINKSSFMKHLKKYICTLDIKVIKNGAKAQRYAFLRS